MIKIRENAKTLKIGYLNANMESFIKEMKELAKEPEEVIEELLEREVIKRRENGILRRIKNAKFTNKMYLEDFKKEDYPTEVRRKLKTLETLEFMDKNENIILIGSPGCGKTHFATALGLKACMEGKTVYFTTVPNLILETKENLSRNGLMNYKKKFEKYDLVILDELGYVYFDKTGCELLFNLLSDRNERGSIIITTNLTFDRWQEIFKDVMLTAAIADRLAHKAHILDLSLEISYRMKGSINWIEN